MSCAVDTNRQIAHGEMCGWMDRCRYNYSIFGCRFGLVVATICCWNTYLNTSSKGLAAACPATVINFSGAIVRRSDVSDRRCPRRRGSWQDKLLIAAAIEDRGCTTCGRQSLLSLAGRTVCPCSRVAAYRRVVVAAAAAAATASSHHRRTPTGASSGIQRSQSPVNSSCTT